MRLKLNEQGQAVLQDGHPVYVHDDGKESPFDAAATVATVRARNAEAKANRERAESAETRLRAFEGIEDADAARKALTTVANLDAKKLVDAGQVETLKAELNKSWQGQLDIATKRGDALEQQLVGEIIGGNFARSKFLADKTVLPPDLAQAAFGKHFKIENGKAKAVDAAGNAIFSKKNPGEPADFDEAIEILVDQYPRKESILRANNGSGSGAPSNNGGGLPQKMALDAFNALPPKDRAEAMQKGLQLVS